MPAPWKESSDKLRQCINKQSHHFSEKSQSCGFSSNHRMWELDIKKAAHQRIDAFELWCWRRLLRVPWTARRSNQSILKEINPEYSLEGRCWSWSVDSLATWCEEPTHWKRCWCWGRLKAGGEEDYKGLDGWMASLTQWMWVWVNSRKWWWTGRPGVLRFMGSQRVRHYWATELNWTERIFSRQEAQKRFINSNPKQQSKWQQDHTYQ